MACSPAHLQQAGQYQLVNVDARRVAVVKQERQTEAVGAQVERLLPCKQTTSRRTQRTAPSRRKHRK